MKTVRLFKTRYRHPDQRGGLSNSVKSWEKDFSTPLGMTTMGIKTLFLIFILTVFSTFSFSLYYGNEFLYPRLSSNSKGYYEVSYGYALFNESNVYKAYSLMNFVYNITDDLMIDMQKKYISNRLALGIMYKYFVDIDFGEIGLGVRNLGINYADTNTPYVQEYMVYSFPYWDMTVDIGIERVIGNTHEIFPIFGGISMPILNRLEGYAYYDYNYIGAGIRYDYDEVMKFDLSGYGMAGGATAGDYKVLEFIVTFINFGRSEDLYKETANQNSKLATEALNKLKRQDKEIKTVTAKMRAMEYIYSEHFQRKLINELVQQKIVEREFKDSKTKLLKTTLKHIQKGLEYYYLNDFEMAYQEYSLANSLYPNMPLIHERLGSIFYKLGHFEKAKKEWLLAISLDPENKDAKEQLLKLEQERPELFIVGRDANGEGQKDDESEVSTQSVESKDIVGEETEETKQ